MAEAENRSLGSPRNRSGRSRPLGESSAGGNDLQLETRDWLEALGDVARRCGPARVRRLMGNLLRSAARHGAGFPVAGNTPYLNTIPVGDQAPYPGDGALEWRIRSLVRWNAMAMVVRANREHAGLGGHLSTFASAATLFEVAFNHFLRGADHPDGADQVFFQGHASPGVYARAFLEGRLDAEQLTHFRQELAGGLPSYPHPWLMPDFWEFPSVSMGLAPIQAIYQARFNRYLEDRGLAGRTGRVWAFVGDGELDEPESLGALTLAAREKLDNLIFVVNCNLQRLDGPVRGNGKIIQELEALFFGAGWNVIKLIWGDSWDPLLAEDRDGLLAERMERAVDGDYQKYSVESGEYIREHFFGTDPELLRLVEHLSDRDLQKLRRGGHDPEKIYTAYRAALDHPAGPSVVLAKTIKGYGLGEAGEGRNVTHQQKKLSEDELREFRDRFEIPLSDEELEGLPFYRPPDDSEEIRYLRERREQLGGPLPARRDRGEPLDAIPEKPFGEFLEGSDDRPIATTMAAVRLLSQLLRDERLGPLLVPIIPDEARTFGMDALFRQIGIYSHVGQRYEPVDSENLLYYREAEDGQLLEEGITEAGSMASFLAAGTSYATHGIPTLPFFFFYSMFGFQRIGDLIWAGGDMRARGFLIGGTAGRTTLNGEGLQHQDGHSHLLALPHPTIRAYDPAYAYELAVIVEDGLRRMLVDGEDCMVYLTAQNEPYPQPAMPEDSRDGILRGLYRVRTAEKARLALLGSGSLLRSALAAAELLEEEYDLGAEVWSATSYKALFYDALRAQRWNRFHPADEPRRAYVEQCLAAGPELVVATSDYSRALPALIDGFLTPDLIALGTDGFGRSDTRARLRDFFEVDERHIALTALHGLAERGGVKGGVVSDALQRFEIDPDRVDPWTA